jgi:hypothetical protein
VTAREVSAHFADVYGVEVSKSVTSITETLVVELWSLTRSSGLLAVVSTVTNVPRDPEELRAMYENGNHEWRRAFIESLVEEIVIGPGVRGLNKFDPARVKIKYRA